MRISNHPNSYRKRCPTIALTQIVKDLDNNKKITELEELRAISHIMGRFRIYLHCLRSTTRFMFRFSLILVGTTVDIGGIFCFLLHPLLIWIWRNTYVDQDIKNV